MRPRNRRHAPASGGRALKLAAIWTTLALASGGIAVAGYVALNAPPDPVALCEREARIVTSTVIIIDTSDALTEIQQRRARVAVEAERDRLPPGGKLTVVTLNDAVPSEPIEVVSACNPGNAGDANPLFTTTSLVEKRWSEAFGQPVEAAISRASEGAEAVSSPLIVTVAGLLTRPDFDARVPHRRLVMISDMLEHQKGGYSQIAGGNFWESYVRSRVAALAPLDLRGVAIAIDYLARAQYAGVQGARHRRFCTASLMRPAPPRPCS